MQQPLFGWQKKELPDWKLEVGELGAHKAIVCGMRVLAPLLSEAELKPRSTSRLGPRHMFATVSAKAENTTG